MKKSKDFFWPSYVDLMTALFLTMLVLFVVSYRMFQVQLSDVKKINEIKEALKRLDDPKYFTYNKDFKRYELSFPVKFDPWDYTLPTESKTPLLQAGMFLAKQMATLDDNVQYLIVIEGRAAKEPRLPDSHPVNMDSDSVRQLSYNRAMAVIRLWNASSISMPKNVEVIAAGSGQRGVGRYSGKQEGYNRRFIIQIQPKIGSLDTAN